MDNFIEKDFAMGAAMADEIEEIKDNKESK